MSHVVNVIIDAMGVMAQPMLIANLVLMDIHNLILMVIAIAWKATTLVERKDIANKFLKVRIESTSTLKMNNI